MKENLGTSKLTRENLSVRVSKAIQAEIQSGELKVGERLLPEVELAEKYGVSRTALREAIVTLKNEGIIGSKPGRGMIVLDPKQRQAFRFSDVFATISLNEVNYFYEMRAALESEAAMLAALRRTDDDLAAIRNAFSGLEKAVETNGLGAAEHEEYNTAIAKASHNPILIEFLSFIKVKLHDLANNLRIKTMLSPERASIVLEEHRAIVHAIEKGDPEESRLAVLTHLKNASERSNIKIL